jgi:hypothetical protein
MENIKDEILMDNLLQEAYRILNNSENLNGDREKLTGILNQMARWNEDHNCEDQQYFDKFTDVVLSMTKLDFSKRLPVYDDQKSVQNFFSITINSLNEELEEQIYSRVLIKKLLQSLPLQQTIVIGTNAAGYVNFLHSENTSLLPPFEALKEQHVKVFFDDMNVIQELIQQQGLEKEITVNMVLGYTGPVNLRIITASWFHNTEGHFYIVTLP